MKENMKRGGAMTIFFALVTSWSYGQAVIIDHTCAKLSPIPLSEISDAKAKLHIAYGHTSHGRQLISGMEKLDAYMTAKGVPSGTYAVSLKGTVNSTVLDFHDWPWRDLGWQQYARDLGTRTDNNNASFTVNYTAWMLTTRKYLGWTPASGDGSNLDHYVTGTPNYNAAAFNNRQVAIVWSWCGQVSYNGDQITTDYLANMSKLVQDYPQVKFVYMTGHVDGTALTGNLHRHNAMIRNHCRQNNRILYDFADIESYDPDGNYYGDKYVSDACNYDANGNNRVEETAEQGGVPKQPINGDKNWALDWQAAHPGAWYTCVINNYHTQHLNDNLKAYAFWWLCARLAGWDGGTTDIRSAATAGKDVPAIRCRTSPSSPGAVFHIGRNIIVNSSFAAGIYAANGRLVRNLPASAYAGDRLTWEGNNDRGARAGRGVYLFTLTSGGKTYQRIIIAGG